MTSRKRPTIILLSLKRSAVGYPLGGWEQLGPCVILYPGFPVVKNVLLLAITVLLMVGTIPLHADASSPEISVVQRSIIKDTLLPSHNTTRDPALDATAAKRIVDDMRRIESTIRYNEPGDPYFGYIKGTIPVLFSAPHGAKHYRTRETRLKGEDAHTAAQAIKLGELTGAYVMYVTNGAPEDSNNDYRTKYKDSLAQVVRDNKIGFVMDLHGSKADRTFTADVGTISGTREDRSCPQQVKVITDAMSGLDGVTFNRHFTANGGGTVIYFAANRPGVGAAQFETNARYRIPMPVNGSVDLNRNDREIADVLRALEKVVLAVSRQLKTIHEGADNAPSRTVTVAK
jgi:hypothetical protein